ncbi:MAG: HepT-like ribonuclease domain-containing protein [Candidatus Magasanikbacteria bacterium]
MRDKMIHEYFQIDDLVVWKTVKSDLPEFKKQIQKILEGYKQKKIKL